MKNGYERTVVFLIGCFMMLLWRGRGGGLKFLKNEHNSARQSHSV